MKYIFYSLLSLLSFTGFSQTDLIIPLEFREGFGPFAHWSYISQPVLNIPRNLQIPTDITEYVFKELDFQRYNTQYNEFLQGLYLDEKPRFDQAIKEGRIDTNLLTTKAYDHLKNILIGSSIKDSIVVIVDVNNDGNFTNDKRLSFLKLGSSEDEVKASKSLPTVEVPYEWYDGKNIIKLKAKVQLNPYKGNLRVGGQDSLQTKYYLDSSVPFYKTAEIKVNGKEYILIVANNFSNPHFAESNLKIIACPKVQIPKKENDGNIPYQFSEVMVLDNYQYKITDISFYGDTLKLKPLGYTSQPIGYTEGYFVPEVKAKTMDNKNFNFKDYEGKYVLLDFWGTWCGPCISLLPDLKKVYEKYKKEKFVLVSIANDQNTDKVKDFIKSHGMDWVNVLQDGMSGSGETDFLNKFKVFQYPSLIFIDPKGKIISRNEGIEKVLEKLKAAFHK